MPRLEACEIDDTTAPITLRVQSTQTRAPCRCAPRQRGASIVTMGAPWQTCPGRSIVCASNCASANGFAAIAHARRIFTERLPTVAAPWARRTLRLAQRLVALGVALGGTAGVRFGHAWGLRVSRNRSCACCAGGRTGPLHAQGSWASMIGRCREAARMAPSSWTWNAASPLPCSGP